MKEAVNLPNIRIVVKPRQGLFKKWKWSVQEEKHAKGHYWWADVYNYTWSPVQGRARTQESALEKAREAAAKYCSYLIAVEKRRQGIYMDTIIEKVICDGR